MKALPRHGKDVGGNSSGSRMALRVASKHEWWPGRAPGERVVHLGCVFQGRSWPEQILGRGSVAAGGFAFDQALRFLRRNAKVEDEAFAWKAVDAVLEMLDPFQESERFAGGRERLVSEVDPMYRSTRTIWPLFRRLQV